MYELGDLIRNLCDRENCCAESLTQGGEVGLDVVGAAIRDLGSGGLDDDVADTSGYPEDEAVEHALVDGPEVVGVEPVGAYHGFDLVKPDAPATRAWYQERDEAFRRALQATEAQ